MGYVTVTETVGEITKTYHFSSYDDFKDWENKISGVVVSASKVDEEGWIENSGLKPLKLNNCVVEVMFRDKSITQDRVDDLYWGIDGDDYDIILYRVVSK